MEKEVSPNLGDPVIEIEVFSPELNVQDAISAVREEIEGFCVAENLTVNVFDVDGRRFRVQLKPLYLNYQIGTITSHLRDVINGIRIVVVGKFTGSSDVSEVGFEGDDEPTVVDRKLLTRDWGKDFEEFQRQLEKGVVVDSPSFEAGGEGEKDE